MQELPIDFIEKSRAVFIENPSMTMLDVLEKIKAEPASKLRDDRMSAFRTIEKKMGGSLATIPASNAGLVLLFRGRLGPEFGLDHRRFSNIKSHVTRAVQTHGVLAPSLTSRMPLSAAWAALRATAIGENYASGITRFACFCSVMGIEPDQVGPAAILLGFHEALKADPAVNNPLTALRLTITYWNMQTKRVPDWPQIRLASPFPSRAYILPLASFPESFQADLANWAARMSRETIGFFDDDGLDSPLRVVTIQYQSKMLQRFASALVAAGTLPVHRMTGLAVLADPHIAAQGLELFKEKLGYTGQLRNIAHILLAVGRHYVKVPAADEERLQAFCKKVRKKLPKRGMTEKNLGRLKPFDDPEVVRRFLNLPWTYVKQAPKDINAYRRAKVYEVAAAAAILIWGRLRIENLRTIRLDQHLRWRGKELILSFTEHETKGKRVLTVPLPEKPAKVIDVYIREHRKQLPGSDGPYLFPGRNSGPRPASTIAADFKKAALKITGLTINPHLVRHIMGTIIVNEAPEMIEVVSEALGHASKETTYQFYLPNGSLPASRIMNSLLEKKLQEAPRRRRKKDDDNK